MKNFSVTDRAIARISAVMEKCEAPGASFRISVEGGGCSGFRYVMGPAYDSSHEDRDFGKGGTRVLIDETSLELLDGSVLDWIEELGGSYFSISNPNATSSCGCGTSFAA
jgi:iron-sulfur cluster assembly accessory protein